MFFQRASNAFCGLGKGWAGLGLIIRVLDCPSMDT
ncbi:MAG: hypothetical protein ACI9W1_000716, partial [Candidatus Azotimanducaceae bacterium]